MGGARVELVAALRAAELPAGWLVVDDTRNLGVIEAPTTAVLQIIRKTIAPAANRAGSYEEELEIWLVDPHLDPAQPDATTGKTLEDSLEDGLDELLAILEALPWLIWQRATRDVHRDEYHAYRVDVTTKTKRKDG